MALTRYAEIWFPSYAWGRVLRRVRRSGGAGWFERLVVQLGGFGAPGFAGRDGFASRIWFCGRGGGRAAELEFEEQLERTEVSALDGGTVASQTAEGVAPGILLEDPAEDAGVRIEALARGQRGGVGVAFHAVGKSGFAAVPLGDMGRLGVEEAGLDAEEARHAELGAGNLLDQVGFFGADGLVLGFEAGEESEERFAVLFGEDAGAGQEAVADGVEGGAGLAFGGARAGGMGGVQAIGLELFVRRHKNTSQLQKSRRGLG